MLLSAPQSFLPAYCTGVALCLLYGGVCSIPAVWDKMFPKLADGTYVSGSYLKAGEYGETELNTAWSVFKEPLNAWTSLVYTLFGIVICFVGLSDSTGVAVNRISFDPFFSVLFGLFCMYLGIASFLFHASHSEVWRKADAGMTSGTVLPLVVFAVWDRLRPPAVTSNLMVAVSVLLLVSLTYGYLPYGSSDILLPSLVAFMWIVELYPRYGGVVDSEQYTLWLQCFFSVAGGALLRAIDIKRKAPAAKRNLLLGYLAVVLVFGTALGFTDSVIVCGVVAGVVVVRWPEKGHIFWHFGSAFALFIWWYMLRVRPGDPSTPYNSDTNMTAILFFVAIKNAVRRIFMNLPVSLVPSPRFRDRSLSLLEHCSFAFWGYLSALSLNIGHNHQAIVKGSVEVGATWLFNPLTCWDGVALSSGQGADSLFHLFYLARIGALAEEVLYHLVVRPGAAAAAPELAVPVDGREVESGVADEDKESLLAATDSTATVKTQSAQETKRDALRLVRLSMAVLLSVSSYFTGYLRIGLVVMFLHDVSDVPADLLRLAEMKGWKRPQTLLLVLTVCSWAYWRVWVFASTVLVGVLVQSKSLWNKSACKVGACSWADTPERGPFFLCLCVLLVFNVAQLKSLAQRCYREVLASKTNN